MRTCTPQPGAASGTLQCYMPFGPHNSPLVTYFSQILSHELPFCHSVAFPPPQIAQAGMWLWTM